MIAADQLSQLQSNIGNLVAEQPPQTEERRRIPDDLFSLADGPVPIGLAILSYSSNSSGCSPPLGLGDDPEGPQEGSCPPRANSSRHQPAQAHAGGTRCSSLPQNGRKSLVKVVSAINLLFTQPLDDFVTDEVLRR